MALKKLNMVNEKDGFPITALREIKYLKQLEHENIVKLEDIVHSKRILLLLFPNDQSINFL
jgi:cyclin-dependent kinase 12/13